jgi:hypothetical protein
MVAVAAASLLLCARISYGASDGPPMLMLATSQYLQDSGLTASMTLIFYYSNDWLPSVVLFSTGTRSKSYSLPWG